MPDDKPNDELRGHCLCGRTQLVLTGPVNWIGHCHCESCRRATASPMTTWIGQENGRWRFEGDAPKTFTSRGDVERGFCGTCGSPLYYSSDKYPNEMHFYAALLIDPAAIQPEAQFHQGEALPWGPCFADLPSR